MEGSSQKVRKIPSLDFRREKIISAKQFCYHPHEKGGSKKSSNWKVTYNSPSLIFVLLLGALPPPNYPG